MITSGISMQGVCDSNWCGWVCVWRVRTSCFRCPWCFLAAGEAKLVSRLPKRPFAPQLFTSPYLVLQLPAPYTSVGEVGGRSPISTGDKFADMLGGALDATRLLMNEQYGRSEQSRHRRVQLGRGGEVSVCPTTPNLFSSFPHDRVLGCDTHWHQRACSNNTTVSQARGLSQANDTFALAIFRHNTVTIPGRTPNSCTRTSSWFFCVVFLFVSVRTQQCDWCFSFKLRWWVDGRRPRDKCGDGWIVGWIRKRADQCVFLAVSRNKDVSYRMATEGVVRLKEVSFFFPIRALWSVLAPWHVWMDAFKWG